MGLALSLKPYANLVDLVLPKPVYLKGIFYRIFESAGKVRVTVLNIFNSGGTSAGTKSDDGVEI